MRNTLAELGCTNRTQAVVLANGDEILLGKDKNCFSQKGVS